MRRSRAMGATRARARGGGRGARAAGGADGARRGGGGAWGGESRGFVRRERAEREEWTRGVDGEKCGERGREGVDVQGDGGGRIGTRRGDGAGANARGSPRRRPGAPRAILESREMSMDGDDDAALLAAMEGVDLSALAAQVDKLSAEVDEPRQGRRQAARADRSAELAPLEKLSWMISRRIRASTFPIARS